MMVRVEGGVGVYRGSNDGIDLLGLPGRGWGIERAQHPKYGAGTRCRTINRVETCKFHEFNTALLE